MTPILAGPETVVAFHHTLALEGRYDGGVVELSTDGGTSWRDAGDRIAEGPYDDWLMTGDRNRVIRPGYTGGTLGPLRESLIWLGDLAGRLVNLRFRLLTDGGGARERWAIDDVIVFDRDCNTVPGMLVAGLETSAPACDGEPVALDAGSTYGGTPPYSFLWDFGDGTPPMAGGARISHLYPRSGQFPVTLVATDGVGLRDRVIESVEVRSDQVPPPAGNVLRAVRLRDDVEISWADPPGEWGGGDVVVATRRDLSDAMPLGRVEWDGARRYRDAGACLQPPALGLYRVRGLSACRAQPGPI
jgi:hypothetical protein